MLGRRAPRLAVEVFGGIDESLAPVVLVGTLLDRLSALAMANRLEAVAAMGLLEQRRLGAVQQAELTLLIEEATAQRFEDADPAPDERAARDEALTALHFWWADWAEVARRAAHNRADLIVLGLVKRRTSRTAEVELETPSTPETAAPGAPTPDLAARVAV